MTVLRGCDAARMAAQPKKGKSDLWGCAAWWLPTKNAKIQVLRKYLSLFSKKIIEIFHNL